jgi:hypothetical protein
MRRPHQANSRPERCLVRASAAKLNRRTPALPIVISCFEAFSPEVCFKVDT